MRRPRIRRVLLTGCLLLAALAIGPAGAQADAPGCDEQALERPFLPWLDLGRYFLVPDGDLAAGAHGWELAGASVVPENEPFWVHDSPRPAALRIRDGGSATSPWTCAGLLDPTLRLFARTEGDLLGSLRVEVLFEDAGGFVRALPVGVVPGLLAGEWAPTLPMPVVANLLPQSGVAFRFTAAGEWLIDDVYVDPYIKG
jgi:hypothetical protein